MRHDVRVPGATATPVEGRHDPKKRHDARDEIRPVAASLRGPLAEWADHLAGGRPYDGRMNDRLAVLLKIHGPTPFAGRLYYADAAGEVRRDRHVSARGGRERAKAVYYDPATGTWG